MCIYIRSLNVLLTYPAHSHTDLLTVNTQPVFCVICAVLLNLRNSYDRSSSMEAKVRSITLDY